MITFALAVGLSLAGSATPAELDAALDALGEPTVRPEAVPRDAAGLEMTIGPATWRFERGTLVPVTLGGRPAGFVFEGRGALEVTFQDPVDARHFANQRVLHLDEDPADWLDVASGEAPWVVPLDGALVLSVDPAVAAQLAATPELPPDTGAQRAAARLLEGRLVLLEHSMDPAAALRLDRVQHDVHGTEVRLLAHLRTTERQRLAPGSRARGDYWIEVTRDPTGAWGGPGEFWVGAVGEVEKDRPTWRTVTSTTWPPLRPGDPDAPPAAPGGVEHRSAEANVTVGRIGKRVDVRVDATLRVRARDREVTVLTVSLPRWDYAWDRWERQALSLVDGTGAAIPFAEVPVERRTSRETEQAANRITLLLGRPLAPGEEATVDVAWTDEWPFMNPSPVGFDLSLGLSTDLQMVLPDVGPSPPGAHWPFTLRVGVPLDAKVSVAISGRTERAWEEGGLSWVEASHTATPAMWPAVAIGDWVDLEADAEEGLPDLRVHLFSRDGIDTFPPEIWQITRYFEQILPPFPYPELEVFEAPAMWFGYVWIAPHGMVALRKARVVQGMEAGWRGDVPHMEAGVLAHEVAHMYWGHAVRGSGGDQWLTETFAETYSCLYLAAAYGPEVCEVRQAAARELFEEAPRRLRFNLHRAAETGVRGAVVYDYGPYVFGRMLRSRLGDQAFIGGLDRLAREHPEQVVSTAELQAAFEAASGQDLSAFFDQWVHGGWIPSLELAWWLGPDGQVEGEVLADVPFGTIEVPVQVGAERLLVEVVDGRGAFRSGPVDGEPVVALDPDGEVLARRRKVRRTSDAGEVADPR